MCLFFFWLSLSPLSFSRVVMGIGARATRKWRSSVDQCWMTASPETDTSSSPGVVESSWPAYARSGSQFQSYPSYWWHNIVLSAIETVSSIQCAYLIQCVVCLKRRKWSRVTKKEDSSSFFVSQIYKLVKCLRSLSPLTQSQARQSGAIPFLVSSSNIKRGPHGDAKNTP